jgi:hypothetical protein
MKTQEKFKVLTAVKTKTALFCTVAPCGLVDTNVSEKETL